MKGFFREWRRKIGVLTLGLACGFMGLWLRSHVVHDAVRFSVCGYDIFLSSWNGWLFWTQCIPAKMDRVWGTIFEYQSEPTGQGHSFLFNLPTSVGPIRPNGIGGFYEFWIIYHSVIVIPLTLISLWLLLSKPRQSTQQKIAEPVQVEGK